MSTESRRARGRRRRSRAFLLAFAAVLGVLGVVSALGAVATVAQGPRVTSVSVDPAAAANGSGARVILTTTQSLREVEPSQVSVEPAADVTVDTSGRGVGVRFALPLRDDTAYTVTIADVQGVGGGPAAQLSTTFRTPPLEVFALQRGTGDGDAVVRQGLDGGDPVTVFTHPHIEDFRATASHLVVSVRTDEDEAALIVTDLDGGNERELALPGDGFVTNLQTADRGERIGYTFSDADLGEGGGRESVLFTASLAAGAADTAPAEVAIAGDDSRVAEWRFVPDTDSILVLGFDSRLLLAAADGSDAAPLGTALAIDGIARGSSQAIVERLEGRVVIDLTDGSETPLPDPDPPLGIANDVVPLPGADQGSLRTYSEISAASVLVSTDVVHVGADAATTVLLGIGSADAALQTCVSPSGRYAAVLVAPDAADNAYDRYLLPLPERLETRIVEVDSGDEVSTLTGSTLSWCQVPPG
jgi:hypothetical protein